MDNYEDRMKAFEQQETEFLDFKTFFLKEKINGQHVNSSGNGLRCLLALTKFLENLVKPISSANPANTCISLDELRKQAEKLGFTEKKQSLPNNTGSMKVNELISSNVSRTGSQTPKKSFSVENLDRLEENNNECLKSKSQQKQTNTLSKTAMERVMTRFIKAKPDAPSPAESHTNSLPRSRPQSTTEQNHNRVYHSSKNVTSSNNCQQPERSSGFMQKHIIPPPTPMADFGDVWLGSQTNERSFVFEQGTTNLSGSSESTQNRQPDDWQSEDGDRCVSLPCNKSDDMIRIRQSSKGVKTSIRNSYEQALNTNGDVSKKAEGVMKKTEEVTKKTEEVTKKTAPVQNSVQSSKRHVGIKDVVTEAQRHQKVDKGYLDSLNQTTVSREFSKKFEKWVNSSKDPPRKSKVFQKRKPSDKGISKQRSMSADRVGSNSEFLTDWGIKQGLGPDYHKNTSATERQSRPMTRPKDEETSKAAVLSRASLSDIYLGARESSDEAPPPEIHHKKTPSTNSDVYAKDSDLVLERHISLIHCSFEFSPKSPKDFFAKSTPSQDDDSVIVDLLALSTENKVTDAKTAEEDSKLPNPQESISMVVAETRNHGKRDSTKRTSGHEHKGTLERGRRVSATGPKKYLGQALSDILSMSLDDPSINCAHPDNRTSNHSSANESVVSPSKSLTKQDSISSLESDVMIKSKSKSEDNLVKSEIFQSPSKLEVGFTTPNSQTTENIPSSHDVLRNIQEDLNVIRRNIRKAHHIDSGIEILTPTYSSGQFSPSSHNEQIIFYDDQLNKTQDIQDPELPKHSVCVDSGMIMNEDSYCEPKLHISGSDSVCVSAICDSRPPNVQDTVLSSTTEKTEVIETDSPDPYLSDDSIVYNPGSSSEMGQDLQTHFNIFPISNAEDKPTLVESHERADNFNADAHTTVCPKEKALVRQASDENNHEGQPQCSESITEAKGIAVSAVNNYFENNSEKLLKHSIEPLLSSDSVTLKTKLRCLTELYSTEEPSSSCQSSTLSAPYDIFDNRPSSKTSPVMARVKHIKSKSDVGLLSEVGVKAPDNQKKSGTTDAKKLSQTVHINDIKVKLTNKKTSATTSAQDKFKHHIDVDKLRNDLHKDNHFEKAKSVFSNTVESRPPSHHHK